MPRWWRIDKDYARVRKQLGISTRLGEILTGILPVYIVEQAWPIDQLDVFGVSGITVDSAFGTTPFFHSCSLLNQLSDVRPPEELLVWRIDANVYAVTQDPVTGEAFFSDSRSAGLHVFTPNLEFYNPAQTSVQEFRPWLQPIGGPRSAQLRTSNARMICGHAPTLETVIVNGVPTPAVGPRMTRIMENTGSSFTNILGANLGFGWTPSPAPPLLVRPGSELTVQSVSPMKISSGLFTDGQRLEVSFWFSTRDAQDPLR